MRSRPYFSLPKLSIVEWCLRIIDHFYFTYTFLWQRCLLFSSWVRCGTYCWQICTISNNCKHTGSVDLIFCNEGQCHIDLQKIETSQCSFFPSKNEFHLYWEGGIAENFCDTAVHCRGYEFWWFCLIIFIQVSVALTPLMTQMASILTILRIQVV